MYILLPVPGLPFCCCKHSISSAKAKTGAKSCMYIYTYIYLCISIYTYMYVFIIGHYLASPKNSSKLPANHESFMKRHEAP